ncbi:MAG: alkaline phosphatase family protein, partial [Gemmataceae bacterium]
MPRVLLISVLILLGVLLTVVGSATPQPTAAPPAPAKVKLAVLLVFDQLRADLITKWRPHFRPDGFRRMQDDGAWFVDCHYPYAATMTGAGHASILTGTTPDRHGIVGNDWYDAGAGEGVYCAGSDRYKPVPAPKVEPKAVAKVEPKAD